VFENLSQSGEKIADSLSKLTEKTNGIEQHLVENFDKIEQKLMDKINAIEQMVENKMASSASQWQLVESRLKKLEEKPAVIEEVQERIEHKVYQLKRNIDVPMCVQTVQGAIEGVLQQDKAEEADIERRKNNVIVHGVPESAADDAYQRTDDDLTVLAAMFQEVEAENIRVESVVRLGKKASDPTGKPRPMKVELDSVDSKINLLKRAKKPEREKGRRLDKSLHSSRLNTEAEGSKKTFGSRAKVGESQRRECNNFQRKDSAEKGVLINREELVCFYVNARNLVNKFEQLEAWFMH